MNLFILLSGIAELLILQFVLMQGLPCGSSINFETPLVRKHILQGWGSLPGVHVENHHKQKDTKQIKPPSCQSALKINADVIKIKDFQ